jgi:hypothetical protein
MIAALPQAHTPEVIRQSSQPARWIKFVVATLVVAAGIGVTVFVSRPPRAWSVDYDWETHSRIEAAIQADPQHLLGRSLDDVSRQLGLDRVPWDEEPSQLPPPGECRLYHFRGFALSIALESLPAGITPEHPRPWNFTDEERARPGVLWLAHWAPSLRIDGVADRAERMRRYWKQLEEMTAHINAMMKENQRNREP